MTPRERFVGLAVALVSSGWIAFAGQTTGQPARQAAVESDAAANQSSVTKQQFDEWMTRLSNWGRWGADDQRGAVNLITPAKRQQAAALVRTGTTLSLSRELPEDKPAATPARVIFGGAFSHRFLIDGAVLREHQEFDYHGGRLSHLDAFCHVSYNGKIYNGLDFKQVVTEDRGCDRLAISMVKDGIVTRGVLLDMPGVRVRPEDVQAWEKRTGVKISAGDVLLLRSRRQGVQPPSRSAGFDPAMFPFLKERDVAVLGHDAAQEGGTIPRVAIPVHVLTLVGLGVHLIDNLDLEALADTAAKLKRWEFMLTVAPLRVPNGAGSAVNPIAIF